MRHYSLIDQVLGTVDLGLRSLFTTQQPMRENPASSILEDKLNSPERKLAGRLMRINHAGEVAAQGLYQGQALTAKDQTISKQLQHAAEQEIDHLRWCEQRCAECNVPVSRLGPFWYAGSVVIGVAAGVMGDKWSLGFLAETEHQVVRHLEDHLQKLPENDQKSRLIVEHMRIEEGEHAATAEAAGAANLPLPVRMAMQVMAKVMTRTAYWL